jgi:hypothetical protein
VHHPNIPVLGFHGWDETVPRVQFSWSVVILLMLFFFLSHFFPRPFFSLSLLLFCPAILEPNFFLGTPTYPSNLPSSLPPPNPSTSLPFALTSTTELLAIAGKRSNTKGEGKLLPPPLFFETFSTTKEEDDNEHKEKQRFYFLFFIFHFVVVKKTTSMSSSSSSNVLLQERRER